MPNPRMAFFSGIFRLKKMPNSIIAFFWVFFGPKNAKFESGPLIAHKFPHGQFTVAGHHRLPHAQPYFDAIAECHRLLFAYFKHLGLARSRCLSYSSCQMPTHIKQPCVVVRSRFNRLRVTGGMHVVYTRTGSAFVEQRHGCLFEGRI